MTFFNNLSKIFNEPSKPPRKGQSKAQSKRPKISQGRPVISLKRKSQARPLVQRQGFQQQAKAASSSVREAEARAREIIVEAKDGALAIHTEAEKKARRLEKQLDDQQRSLDTQLNRLDDRLGNLEKKENNLEAEQTQLDKLRQELEKAKASVAKKMQKVAKISVAEAKQELMSALEKSMGMEMAQYISQREEKTKQEADEKATQIVIEAMKYGATDHVAEYTVSVVEIPSEKTKGKIIGRNGRNIHAFERVTGVDVDLDASPTEIKISSFDPIRREIARVSLERLIKDGRIQPARIEEIVKKVQTEIDKIVFEAGKQLCKTVGVYNLPNDLIAMLGRFKYRFSYGQNMITHTIEETKIGTKIAHELGLDVNVVKLGCLLHDIGKVAEDPDDNHVALGVRIAKKFDMSQEVIDCIAQHHEDEPFSGPEQMAVYIADAISGARPGARYENHEEYIKRLEDLEEIAMSHPEVKQAYAVQAGRELRVLLEPEKSKDDDVKVLVVKIRDEIQEKVMVPGSVRVTVIRENRAEEKTK